MNKLTQKQRQYQQITNHGNNLNAIFHTDLDPVKLCKKLHSLEIKAHKLATDYCNGDITTEQWEGISEGILYKTDKILNFINQKIPVFVNGDCRGYTLKIKDKYISDNNITIYRDWGGYGIIAPEFDGRV